MPKKLKVKWEVGSEFLPPNTIKESANNVLLGDKFFGDGTMTFEEAKELVIQFREKHKDLE